MKNRIFLSALAAGLLLFSACESDRESNPTLTVPESFELNEPAMSDGVYDLDNAKFVELTCSQPEYGYTAPVTYTVELSLDESFETMEPLITSYTTAKMDVVASEMAVSITNLKVAEGMTDKDFPMTTPVYIRLKADLSNIDATVYSNTIQIDTRLSFSLPPVTFPENLYLIGSICDWSWDTAFPMVPVYANGDGEFGGSFWRMVYFSENSEIKFNTATSWNGGEIGYGGVTIEDNAGANVSDNGGNIKVATAGWYIVLIKAEVDGLDLKYTMSFYEPNVYLYGATVGDVWEAKEENLFSVPLRDGEFVSPRFSGAGEIRACVVLPNTDWWKSEFIVIDEKLEYRGNGKDQERVSGAVDQRLYISFTDGEGKVE